MGIQFGFHLMKLPDTLFFYVGLTIVMVIAFIIGWFVIKELNKIFSDDKEKSEKNEGNKE
jgi:phage shock protein PspC (stress-responsive transcriptional regulator)